MKKSIQTLLARIEALAIECAAAHDRNHKLESDNRNLEDSIQRYQNEVTFLAGVGQERLEDVQRLTGEVRTLRVKMVEAELKNPNNSSRGPVYEIATRWRSSGNKIMAIKEVRTTIGCGLLEAKTLVEAVWDDPSVAPPAKYM